MKLIVCEDDFLILMNTSELLRDLGHEIAEAANGGAALAALADGPFDALLTDVGLPDMNGVDLAHRARAVVPGLPIIFASGLGKVAGFEGDPAVAFVGKPYTMPEIERALSAVVGR